MIQDIRTLIFEQYANDEYLAHIRTEGQGILSGVEEALGIADALGIRVEAHRCEGDAVCAGEVVMTLRGTPLALAKAEEQMIGAMAKPSGIATAARQFAEAAGDELHIICGAWKKAPMSVRAPFRRAVQTGGCGIRMLEQPMVYLDKNYVAMLGGVKDTLNTVKGIQQLQDRKIVIQVKGTRESVASECWAAAHFGADVVFVDTGRIEDLKEIDKAVEYMEKLPIFAYGGNVTLADVPIVKASRVSILGVGRAILDAPMLDMKLDVVPISRPCHCKQNVE